MYSKKLNYCLVCIAIDELMQIKRGRTRTVTKPGSRPLIPGPLDFRHEQHIGVDWMGSGSPSEHSMQAGLNQAAGSDGHPLMKVFNTVALCNMVLLGVMGPL